MTETSARFGLPLIEAGQAQKELNHNEALALVDVALHASAQGVGTTTPPATPAAGQCWVVGAGAAGAWTGQDNKLAAWTSGGWRFVSPVLGMLVWSIVDGVHARWDGSAWQVGAVVAAQVKVAGTKVVGAQQAAIADPAGGTTADAQARTAVQAILAALRVHGLIAT